jgi:glutathione-regulated potassium-efflux system ancillary protein KefG
MGDHFDDHCHCDGEAVAAPTHTAARILVLFAHPAFEKSRVNHWLVDAARGLSGITFHDLYEEYPDFDIDVPREQGLLLEHSGIVFQHPFFWYSTPAILKQWQDLVLEHGWAYGSRGTALQGKWLLSATTTGGREDAYTPRGRNRFTIRQLLAPIEQTAALCGMTYLPPFVVHGTLGMREAEMRRHADAYRRVLVALRDGAVDLEAAHQLPRLNADLEAILRPAPEDA